MNGLMMTSQLTLSLIMDHAERFSGDQEIVSHTADNPRHRYTYKNAFNRVRQLANCLRALELSPGDRVGTIAWNDYRHFEVYYAVSCSGYVCHTVNPRLTPEQIIYIINHAEDQYVFIDRDFVPLLDEIAKSCPSVKGWIVLTSSEHMPKSNIEGLLCYEELIRDSSDIFEWPALDENSACGLCYTSGTTGNPKGVLYSHRATVLHALAAVSPDAMAISSNEVVMPIVPMFHVNAWGLPYSCPMVGAKIVFPGSKMGDGETLCDLVNEESVSMSAGVPTVWLALLSYLKSSGRSVDSLKSILVGGAACPLSIMEDFDDYGVSTNVGWGMTEMSPLGALNQSIRKREKWDEDHFATVRQKAGRPLFGVEMKIVDEHGIDQPHDGVKSGALKVRGPWICSSYYRITDSEAHNEDGWFDTGDVATIDPDGYMAITDRTKDIIKSGGEWISSIELENAATDHPQIAEAAVIGIQHPKWSERPLLVVVKAPGCEPTKESILETVAGQVAKWWVPEDVAFVDELPHTATGKISKKDLREQFKDYRFPGV